MKSPMLTLNPALAGGDADVPNNRYSDLQVLKSNAGYYIGTLYQEFDQDGRLLMQYPGSRDSCYFPTEKDAELELRQMEGGDLSAARLTP